MGEIAAIRRFVRAPVGDRCDACGSALAPDHEHRVHTIERRTECVCPTCAARDPGGVFRRVRRHVTALGPVEGLSVDWDRLGIPVRIAFFVASGDGGVTAFFPSPAGATQFHPSRQAWDDLRASSPAVAGMTPEVDALLVNHLGSAREQYVVSIDVCYELVGSVRRHWRGFSGGDDAWSAVETILSTLRREGAACPD
ncbi:MAG: DUF5947 family protein [Polyangiaceae bacterium]